MFRRRCRSATSMAEVLPSELVCPTIRSGFPSPLRSPGQQCGDDSRDRAKSAFRCERSIAVAEQNVDLPGGEPAGGTSATSRLPSPLKSSTANAQYDGSARGHCPKRTRRSRKIRWMPTALAGTGSGRRMCRHPCPARGRRREQSRTPSLLKSSNPSVCETLVRFGAVPRTVETGGLKVPFPLPSMTLIPSVSFCVCVEPSDGLVHGSERHGDQIDVSVAIDVGGFSATVLGGKT